MRLFPMKSCPARVPFAQAGAARALAALAIAVLIAGCGDNYRPVVTPIGTNGPPAQPTSYTIVASTTGSQTPGVVTIIDYAGDSILNETPIGPGPLVFTLDGIGATATPSIATARFPNFPINPTCRPKTSPESTLPQFQGHRRSPLTCFRRPSWALGPRSQRRRSRSLLTGRHRPSNSRFPVATTGNPATIARPGRWIAETTAVNATMC